MATSSFNGTDDGRSGGKILKRRRRASIRTPYDRPSTPALPPPQPENSNWFRGIISPAKTAAGKILSSFWNSDTWCSSSDSDSDSEAAASEDGVEENSVHYAIPFDGVETVALNGKNVTSSGMIKDFSKESRLNGRKSEVKHLIEQLLMLENFSRDESDRLIEIINSRVVELSQEDGVEEGLCVSPHGRTSNAYTSNPDICNQAVVEARRWLEEKNAGSSSKSHLDHQIHALNSVSKEHVNDSEVGSPVDVAKSYMRARPLWSSPAIKHSQLTSPSPMTTELFSEATLYLKRDSLSAGSWNIQQEIRKLRSKATEDMLRTHPSAKLDTASFSPEHKTSQYGSGPNNSVEPMNTFDLSALDKAQDGEHTEGLLSYPPLIVPGQNQDLESIQRVEGEGDEFGSHHGAHPEFQSGQHLGVAESNNVQNDNDSAAFLSSLPADIVMEEKHGLTDEGNPIPDRSTFVADIIPGKGTCGFLTETSIEIPNVNETIVSEPKSSCSVPLEEPLPELSHAKQASDFEGTASSVIEKRVGKKPSRYARKVRGKGKG